MKIERIDLKVVRLPLVRSFRTSSSSKSHLDHILVRVAADGEVGWGECASPSHRGHREVDADQLRAPLDERHRRSSVAALQMQHAQTLDQPRTAERSSRCAICLVEGRLEDERQV